MREGIRLNFIKTHIVEKIKKEISLKGNRIDTPTSMVSWYYFDEPIVDGKRRVNRVSKFNPFGKEDIIPINWFEMSGGSLLELYAKLKDDKFFYYKLIDGKSYKTRLK